MENCLYSRVWKARYRRENLRLYNKGESRSCRERNYVRDRKHGVSRHSERVVRDMSGQ